MDYSKTQDLMEMNEGTSDPWNGAADKLTNSKLCFFRIYEVNAEQRTCNIKTFGSEPAIANADYMDVQWLALYSDPEGAEMSYVPRMGAYGICAFVGGEPYIMGYFNPIVLDQDEPIEDQENEGVDVVGGSAATNKEKVNPGDYILRTIGRCRIVLRAGGEIELEATKICRRTYFPARNRITEISQNLEVTTDGGSMNWTHIDQDANSEETLCTQIWKDDVESTNVIKDEKGTVSLGTNLIHRFQISAGANVNEHLVALEEPVLIRETYNTGKTEFKINKTAYTELIMPDGTYTRGIGEQKNLVAIKPTGEMHVNINKKYDRITMDTGETTVNIADKWKLNIKPEGTTSLNVADKCKVDILPSGETKIDVGPGKSTITIKPSGEIEVKTTSKIKLDAGAEVDVKAPIVKLNGQASGITTANSHQNVVDLITCVPVTPSATVFGDI